MALSTRKQIIDTDIFRDILDLISYDSGVFLDLDDTVIASETELGSNQWFIALSDQALKICETREEADALVFTICQAVHPYVQVKPVEPIIPTIIKTLQTIGIPVLALTARDYLTFEMTLKELKELQIDFSRRPHDHNKIILGDPEDRTVYHEGIIFCNGQSKGKCLELYLEKCDRLTSHYVMADDKLKHTKTVKKAVENLGKRYDGMRYGHLDHRNINLNMKEANQHIATLVHNFPKEVIDNIKRLKLLPEHSFALETKSDMATKLASKKYFAHSEIQIPKSITRVFSQASLFHKKKQGKPTQLKPMVRSRSALSVFAPKQGKLLPMLIPKCAKTT